MHRWRPPYNAEKTHNENVNVKSPTKVLPPNAMMVASLVLFLGDPRWPSSKSGMRGRKGGKEIGRHVMMVIMMHHAIKTENKETAGPFQARPVMRRASLPRDAVSDSRRNCFQPRSRSSQSLIWPIWSVSLIYSGVSCMGNMAK